MFRSQIDTIKSFRLRLDCLLEAFWRCHSISLLIVSGAVLTLNYSWAAHITTIPLSGPCRRLPGFLYVCCLERKARDSPHAVTLVTNSKNRCSATSNDAAVGGMPPKSSCLREVRKRGSAGAALQVYFNVLSWVD
jgi:hypothetical protein